MHQIALGSVNSLKRRALIEALKRLDFGNVDVLDCAAKSLQNEQPVGLEETYAGALARAKGAKEVYFHLPCMGIENGIVKVADLYVDLAVVVLLTNIGGQFVGVSPGIVFPTDCVQEAEQKGFATTTVGSVIAERIGGYAADPHSILTCRYFTRYDQLVQGIIAVLAQSRSMIWLR